MYKYLRISKRLSFVSNFGLRLCVFLCFVFRFLSCNFITFHFVPSFILQEVFSVPSISPSAAHSVPDPCSVITIRAQIPLTSVSFLSDPPVSFCPTCIKCCCLFLWLRLFLSLHFIYLTQFFNMTLPTSCCV